MKKQNKKEKRERRTFRHFNQLDRDRIEALKNSGHTQKEIAKILDFSESSISREINRHKMKTGVYRSTTAENKAQVKRLNSKYQGMKIEKCLELKQKIITKLGEDRSPDEIAGRMNRNKEPIRCCTDAIYKWLYSPYGQAHCHLLCSKRYKKKKRKKKTKKQIIPNRISLSLRPKEGIHAEGDLFVSPIKSGSSKSGMVLCVPVAKMIVGTFIEDKSPEKMKMAVLDTIKSININDLTLDNGIENRKHEEFGVPTYFCDPYSSWQKPHIENGIRIIRIWYIPKGTNLEDVTEKEFQYYLHKINSKHRKSLGYRSAYEVALEYGIIDKIPSFEE